FRLSAPSTPSSYTLSLHDALPIYNNGIFGYTAYDAVKYFEDIEISEKPNSIDIPDIYYAVYQNIIAINHFKNEAYIFAHCHDTEDRKSTRLNSSHVKISYAAFCLK